MSTMRKKIMETVTITRLKDEEVFCDICGEDCNASLRSSYDVARVEIRMEEGSSYPEGLHTETYRPDICLTCGKDKVIPALEALGVKVKWVDTNEVDY